MINTTKIKKSITGLLKEVKDIDIFYEDVEKTDSEDKDNIITDFFYVSMIPVTTRVFDENYVDRTFLLDISYISKNPSNAQYFDWNEKMIETFLPVINIEDRYITIYSNDFKIVNQVGHFTFTIQFRDTSFTYDNKQDEDIAGEIDINFEEV